MSKEAHSTVLVTGSTGALGRYLIDELLARQRHRVVLVVRDPTRLPPEIRQHPVVTVHASDVRDATRIVEALPRLDGAILMATSWGPDSDARQVNVEAAVALAVALRRQHATRLVWVGTASILDGDGSVLEAARLHGTPYIRSKVECRRQLFELWPSALTAVHPTLIVAGGHDRPPSHVARLIHEVDRRAWLAQWITAPGRLHMIHAADLARLLADALESAPPERSDEIVAGAPVTTVRELLDLFLERNRRRRLGAVGLSQAAILALVRWLRIELTAWDRFCLERGEFVYDDARLTLAASTRPLHPTARAVIATIPVRER